MDCKDCLKNSLDDQIRLIGEQIKSIAGIAGMSEDILDLAKAQQILVETKRMF